MSGRVTTIVHPVSKESHTFAFDHSYWSHDGFSEDERGVSVPVEGASTSDYSYADQVCTNSTIHTGPQFDKETLLQITNHIHFFL
jgi:hypothetical protein